MSRPTLTQHVVNLATGANTSLKLLDALGIKHLNVSNVNININSSAHIVVKITSFTLPSKIEAVDSILTNLAETNPFDIITTVDAKDDTPINIATSLNDNPTN